MQVEVEIKKNLPLHYCTVICFSPTTSIFRCIDRECTTSTGGFFVFFFLHLVSCSDVSQCAAVIGCSLLQLPQKQKQSDQLRVSRAVESADIYRKSLFWHSNLSLHVHITSARENRGMLTGSGGNCLYLETLRSEHKKSSLRSEKKSEIWAVSTSHCLQQNPAKVYS